MRNRAIRAVLFDFGGVMTESPFNAFREFERSRGLPEGFLQSVNRRNADDNAWARFERSELTPAEFDQAFAAESGQLGHAVRGLEVIALLHGPVRPRMVQAVARCREHFLTACLTNNVQKDEAGGSDRGAPREHEWRSALDLFHAVIESSRAGSRKPEPRFYRFACEALRIEPCEAVFLDDLGSNLKPARAMGMKTIKVADPDTAIAELERALGVPLG
jgi:putative hydrolase of the HAD superfamily